MGRIFTSLYPNPPPISALNAPDGSFNAGRIYLTHAHPEGKNYIVYAEADTGREIGYNEFWARVRDARVGMLDVLELENRGCEGETFGIIGDNCIDYPTIVHMSLGLAIPFALLPTHSTPHELAHALRTSKPTRVFVGKAQLELVRAVAKDVGIPDSNIYTFGGYGQEGRLSVDKLVKCGRDKLKVLSPAETERIAGLRPASVDTIAYFVFSSGTTGLPKAVMITHGNLATANFQAATSLKTALQFYAPPTPKTASGLGASLAFLPMYHTYGIHSFGFRNLLRPCTVVFMQKWDVRAMVDVAAKYQLSELALVPSAVQQLVEYLNTQSKDEQLNLAKKLSSVVSLTSGAAYLAPSLTEQLLRFLGRKVPSSVASYVRNAPVRMSEGYGMSETTSAVLHLPVPGLFSPTATGLLPKSEEMSTSPPDLPPPGPGASGILLPGQLARIVDGYGNDAPLEEPGELWLAGGCIAAGYYQNDKATSESFVKDTTGEYGNRIWLRTGDRFWTDGKWFYFVDRAKDTLKISGVQVSPAELETVILDCPVVSDVAVAGVPRKVTAIGTSDRVPRAWVVLNKTVQPGQDNETVERMIEQWVKERLSKPKWLRGGVEIVTEIPKSPTGKVLRRYLQDSYERTDSPAESKTRAKL